MITKFRVDEKSALPEFGMACQRLIPWTGQDEPPMGLMACFLPPGSSSDPDLHSQDEVMLILSGSGSVDLAGSPTTAVEAHELVVLPGNHEHVVHNNGSEPLVWVSLYWPLHEVTE